MSTVHLTNPDLSVLMDISGFFIIKIMNKKSKYYSIEEQRRHKEIKRMFNYYSQEPTFYSSSTKETLDDYDQNPEKEGMNSDVLQDNRT